MKKVDALNRVLQKKRVFDAFFGNTPKILLIWALIN